MTFYQITLFTIAVGIFLLFQLDDNVRQYFLIRYDLLKLNITEKWQMWIMLHPKNPIANYFFERKYRQLEKKLEEIDNGNV